MTEGLEGLNLYQPAHSSPRGSGNFHESLRERRVVDVVGKSDDRPIRYRDQGRFSSSNRAASARVVEGWPGASSAEIPCSGISNRRASARLSLAAIQRAHRRFSSAVVRMSVTWALWTWSFLLETLRHGLDRAEIDHVEGADRKDVGNLRPEDRLEAARSARQDAADHLIGDLGGGDVEDPLDEPGLTSFSIAWPPVPVAWNTRQSKPRRLERFTHRVTQGVVTPNIVIPSVGLPSDGGAGYRTMPAIAAAALPSTRRETELSPETSTTEYMSVMSLEPT